MKRLLNPVLLALSISPGLLIAGGDPPVANYSYYVEIIGVGSEVSFLNESIDADSYYWDFDDGATSTDLNPVHPYPEPGIFNVCLTATNEFGSDTFCDTINTYYAPSADFSFAGDPEVTFTDLSTNYPESWDWFFGDDSTSNLQNPVHTYLANGVYTVCLSVSNPGGTNYTCKDVVIASYAITEAAFSYSGDPEVTFTDLSTNSPTIWFWDFGDGITSTEQNPVHLYADNGIFNVCLTATNAGGTDTYCEDVNIIHAIAPPVVDFSFITIGLEAAFVDLSTNDPLSWYWDFGDGENSVEQNPVHTFDSEGNYNVCLTATNEGGSNTTCKDVFAETSIDQTTNLSAVIYPNPAGELINITLPAGFSPDVILTYNISGELTNLNFSLLKADISNLPSGIYTTKIISEERMITLTWMRSAE